jgi:DNA-binding transcriptional MerR regulator
LQLILTLIGKIIMADAKVYSVSQLSKFAGVSVKTLHYYDHKGLLVPMRQPDNGYRTYDQNHVVILQQILIYRALDFSIEAIKSLLIASNHDLHQTLLEQKMVLVERKQSISLMINSIEMTMNNLQAKKNLDIFFQDIPKEKVERWDSMTRSRVGDDKAEETVQVFAKLSEQEAQELHEESLEITKAFAKTIGQPFDSKEVQELTDKHYKNIHHMASLLVEDFIGISFESYVQMANSVDMSEMEELCEYYGEGYAEHAREAMIYYAEQNLKDNK